MFNGAAFISSNLVFNGNGYLVDGKVIRFHYHMPFLSILFFLVESLLFDQLQLEIFHEPFFFNYCILDTIESLYFLLHSNCCTNLMNSFFDIRFY